MLAGKEHTVAAEDWGVPLCIYSCHDSSLIGLMCAFRLEQPSVWPEYGSYLKVELFAARSADATGADTETNADADVDGYYVRFSLNGNVLQLSWGVGQDGYERPSDVIPLDHLVSTIEREYKAGSK